MTDMTDAPPTGPTVPDGPTGPAATGATEAPDGAGRKLFRYVTGEEWREYRAIMAVFAGTFFSEFTPEEVASHLSTTATPIDPAVAGDRLESLRRWGNLSVSSSVGNPSSLADYYKRRNRYLITRAGQEVHDVVEGVLSRVDQVSDVSAGRLRQLRDALEALLAADPTTTDPVQLADLVRAVFDPHQAFTSEITQFFASINQWQSRYDLSPDEFTFFAEVLVGYVAERLDEIERTARPIGRRLADLVPAVPTIVERANRGLSARVADAGLAESVHVTQTAGGRLEDWDHLAGWFVARDGRASRIDQLGRDAVSAIRTLTLNLTRLSRVGIGASSKRADFLRLATIFDVAAPDDTARLAVAAFGLHPTNHLGSLAADADDPVSSATSWSDAPRATVAVSLRERGDTTNRGRPTPLADRSQAQELLRRRRERELADARLVDLELLEEPELDGRTLTAPALARLQQVLARTMHELHVRGSHHQRRDGSLLCTVRRTPGRHTAVRSPDGTLTLLDLQVTVAAATSATSGDMADRGGTGGGTTDGG
jgi:uncharacterized protein (TIGR02677 family)